MWDITGGLNVTLDYFNIEVKDRILLSGDNVLSPADIAALIDSGVTDAGDLTEFRFFTNGFDTTTSGVDVVATYGFDWAAGTTALNFAYNITETEVDRASEALNRERTAALEDGLPDSRWYLTAVHHVGDWRVLARVNFYDSWTLPGGTPAADQDYRCRDIAGSGGCLHLGSAIYVNPRRAECAG